MALVHRNPLCRLQSLVVFMDSINLLEDLKKFHSLYRVSIKLLYCIIAEVVEYGILMLVKAGIQFPCNDQWK